MQKEPKSRVVTLSKVAFEDVAAHMEEAAATGPTPSRGSVTSYLVRKGREAVLAERAAKAKKAGGR